MSLLSKYYPVVKVSCFNVGPNKGKMPYLIQIRYTEHGYNIELKRLSPVEEPTQSIQT
jgi:hypothetical protein